MTASTYEENAWAIGGVFPTCAASAPGNRGTMIALASQGKCSNSWMVSLEKSKPGESRGRKDTGLRLLEIGRPVYQ